MCHVCVTGPYTDGWVAPGSRTISVCTATLCLFSLRIFTFMCYLPVASSSARAHPQFRIPVPSPIAVTQ